MKHCARCGITEETHPMECQYGEIVCYECASAERDAQAERARAADPYTREQEVSS